MFKARWDESVEIINSESFVEFENNVIKKTWIIFISSVYKNAR